MTELWPLSSLQQRLWHLCTDYPGDASPTVYLSYRLRGPLDLPALTRAYAALTLRHPALRTSIVRTPDGPRQAIAAEASPLQHLDLSELDAQILVSARTRTYFPLDGEPLAQACLIRLDPDDHVFSLVVHHIVADGASAAILTADLVRLYHGADLPPLDHSYLDFVAEQEIEPALTHWVQRLRGTPVQELPLDLPRPPAKQTRSADLPRRLPAPLADAIDSAARAHRCTPYVVLLTAYARLLAELSGQTDICVGSPLAGRTRDEYEQVVGLFGNTLPLRLDLSGAPSTPDLIRRVRSVVFAALSHQDVPFGQILARLELPPDPSRTPLFPTILALHTQGDSGLHLRDLEVSPFAAGLPQMIHDLVLDAWRRPDGIELAWRYDTALFLPATVEKWADRFEDLLRELCA